MIGFKKRRSMVTKKLLFLALSSIMLCTMAYSAVPQYSKEDKKKFDDLVDVSFTKGKFATKARKQQRTEDLRQLAALMARQVANLINGEVFKEVIEEVDYIIKPLSEGYKTEAVLDQLSPLLSAALKKPNLIAANRFATYDFEKTFEDNIEKRFKARVETFTGKKTFKRSKDLQAAYQAVQKDLEQHKLPFNHFTLHGALERAKKKISEDQQIYLETIGEELTIEKAVINTELDAALNKFNATYKKVIAALRELTKQSPKELPSTIFLGDLKKGEIKL
jgi:hypothetical protein